jgi:hypothetical protein
MAEASTANDDKVDAIIDKLVDYTKWKNIQSDSDEEVEVDR